MIRIQSVINLLAGLFVLAIFGCGRPAFMHSPNERIQVRFFVENGHPKYSVYLDEEIIIKPSKLGFHLKGQEILRTDLN